MQARTVFFIAALVGAASPALAGGFVYVPTGGANQVLVIDAATDKVVGRLPGVKDSHGLAGTADGRLLVAGSITEAEAGDRTPPPKPKGMSEGAHRVHHPAKSADAGAEPKSVSYLSVIRTADMSVTRRVEVPGAVHHTLITPDGRFAVATLLSEDGISVVDLNGFEVLPTVRTGSTPNYAVASPDSRRVYVSNSGDNTVSEIDTENWAVRKTIAVGETPGHMAMSPDGKTLYVNNADAGTVSAISVERGAVVNTYRVGGGLHGIDVSDDGKTLFVAGWEDGKLVAIDVAGGGTRSASLAPSPYHLAAIRGAGKLYVSSAGENKIWVVDQKSLRVRGEIPVPGRAHQMVVATD